MKLWHWIGLLLIVLWVSIEHPFEAANDRSSSTERQSQPSQSPSANLPAGANSNHAKPLLYVTGSVVNVRGGPSTSYTAIAQLKRSDQVQELSRQNGWVEIRFANGQGWMFGKYLASTRDQPASQPIKQAPSPKRCHPNYSGACVPIASDVDCAGGSGNGPAYVRGPVRVIGPDVYRLDRDHDGIGCE